MEKKVKYEDWYIDESAYPENIYWSLLIGFEDNTQQVLAPVNNKEIKTYYFPQKYIINGIEYGQTGQQWLSEEEFRNFESFQEEFCNWDKSIKPPNDFKNNFCVHLRKHTGSEYLIKVDFKTPDDFFCLNIYNDGLMTAYGNKESLFFYTKDSLFDWIKNNKLVSLQKNRKAQVILAEKRLIAEKYLKEEYASENFIKI